MAIELPTLIQRIVLDTSSVDRSQAETTNKINALNAALKDSAGRADDATGAHTALGATINSAGQSAERASQSHANLAAQVARGTISGKEATATLNGLEKAHGDVTRATIAAGEANETHLASLERLKSVSGELKPVEGDLAKAHNDVAMASLKAEEAGRSLSSAKAKESSLTEILTGLEGGHTRASQEAKRAEDEHAGSSNFLTKAIDSLGKAHSDTSGLMGLFKGVMLGIKFEAMIAGAQQAVTGILALGGAAFSVISALAPMVGLLGAVPAGILGMGAIVGTVKTGLSGVLGAVKAYGTEQGKAGSSAASSAKTIKSANESVESAQRALTRTETSSADAIVSAETAVVKAKQNVVDVADAGVRKITAANETVTTSEQHLADVVESNAASIQGAKDQVISSQKALATTYTQAEASITAADQHVVDAEKNLVDAQKASEDAQLALTQARKDAAEQLVQLGFAAEGATLSEAHAQLSLTDATTNYNKVMASRMSTDRQKLDASLALADAQLALAEAQDRTKTATEAATAATAKGVEGSDLVKNAVTGVQTAQEQAAAAAVAVVQAEKDAAAARVAAADQITAAQKQATDAVTAEAKAERDAARAIVDANKQITDAITARALAGTEVARANIDAQTAEADAEKALAKERITAADSIADAQRSLQHAIEALSDAQTKSGGAASAYSAAMAKLSPEAKKLVGDIISVKDAFKAVQKGAEEGLLPGVDNLVLSMRALIPTLTSVFKDTGYAIGGIATQAGLLVSSPAFNTQLAQIGHSNALALAEIGGTVHGGAMGGPTGLMGVVTAFMNIASAAEPLIKWIGGLVNKFGEWVAQITGGEAAHERLVNFFTRSIALATQVGHIFGDLGVALFHMGKTSSETGQSFLTSLEAMMAKFREWTGSFDGQNKMKAFFESTIPIIHSLSDLIGAVAKGIGGMYKPGQLAPLIDTIKNDILPNLLKIFGSVDVGFAPKLIEAISGVVKIVAQLSGEGGALLGFIDVLNKLLSAISWGIDHIGPFKDLFIAIVAGFATLEAVKFLGKPFEALAGGLKSATGLVGGFGQSFGIAAKNADGSLKATEGFLARTGSIIGDTVRGALQNFGLFGGQFAKDAEASAKAASKIVADQAKALGDMQSAAIVENNARRVVATAAGEAEMAAIREGADAVAVTATETAAAAQTAAIAAAAEEQAAIIEANKARELAARTASEGASEVLNATLIGSDEGVVAVVASVAAANEAAAARVAVAEGIEEAARLKAAGTSLTAATTKKLADLAAGTAAEGATDKVIIANGKATTAILAANTAQTAAVEAAAAEQEAIIAAAKAKEEASRVEAAGAAELANLDTMASDEEAAAVMESVAWENAIAANKVEIAEGKVAVAHGVTAAAADAAAEMQDAAAAAVVGADEAMAASAEETTGAFMTMWLAITAPIDTVVLIIAAVVAAVLALAGIGYELYQHWKPFHDLIDSIWQGVQVGWDAVKPVFDSMIGFIEDHWKVIATVLGALAMTFDAPLVIIIGAIAVVVANFQTIKTVVSDVAGFIIDHWKWFAGAFAIATIEITWPILAAIGVFLLLKDHVVAIATYIGDHWKSFAAMFILLTWPISLPIIALVRNFGTIKDVVMAVVGFVIDHWKLLAQGIGIAFGPIGIIITQLITHFDTVKAVVGDVVDVVTRLWDKFTHLFKTGIDGGALAPLTEGFIAARDIIGGVVGWLADKIGWVVDKVMKAFAWLYDVLIGSSIIPDIVDGIVAAFTVLSAVIGPIFDVIKAVIVDAFTAAAWAWDNILRPAFEVIGTVVGWLWNTIIQPAFQAIGDEVGGVFAGIKAVWDAVLAPVFTIIATVVTWLWNTIIQPVFQFIGDHWREVIFGMVGVWNTYGKPVFDAIGGAASWLWNNIIQPVFTNIKSAVETAFGAIGWAWDHTLGPVMDKLQSAFAWIKDNASSIWSGFANAIVSAFQNVWNIVHSILAPIAHLIGGLTSGIGSILNAVGLGVAGGPLRTAGAWLSGFEEGGTLPDKKRVPGLAGGGHGQFDNVPMVEVGPGLVAAGARAIVGEGNPAHPEYVVPTDPKYRDRAVELYKALGRDLNLKVKLMAEGGRISGMFPGGSIISAVGSGISTVAGAVTDVGKGIVGGIVDISKMGAGEILSLAANAWQYAPGWLRAGAANALEHIWPEWSLTGNAFVDAVPGLSNQGRKSATEWIRGREVPAHASGGILGGSGRTVGAGGAGSLPGLRAGGLIGRYVDGGTLTATATADDAALRGALLDLRAVISAGYDSFSAVVDAAIGAVETGLTDIKVLLAGSGSQAIKDQTTLVGALGTNHDALMAQLTTVTAQVTAGLTTLQLDVGQKIVDANTAISLTVTNLQATLTDVVVKLQGALLDAVTAVGTSVDNLATNLYAKLDAIINAVGGVVPAIVAMPGAITPAVDATTTAVLGVAGPVVDAVNPIVDAVNPIAPAIGALPDPIPAIQAIPPAPSTVGVSGIGSNVGVVPGAGALPVAQQGTVPVSAAPGTDFNIAWTKGGVPYAVPLSEPTAEYKSAMLKLSVDAATGAYAAWAKDQTRLYGQAPTFLGATGGTVASIGGGFITGGPQILVGEGNQSYPEYVIPTDPQYRPRASSLFAQLAAALGIRALADGGVIGDVSPAVTAAAATGAMLDLRATVSAGFDAFSAVNAASLDSIHSDLTALRVALATALTQVTTALGAALDSLTTALGGVIGATTDAVTALAGQLATDIGTLTGTITTIGATHGDLLEAIRVAVELLGTHADPLLSAVAALPDQLTSLVTNPIMEAFKRLPWDIGALIPTPIWTPIVDTLKHMTGFKAAAGMRIGSGFVTGGPQILVGEGNAAYPEYVIPTDPQYRPQSAALLAHLMHDLGLPALAAGGSSGTAAAALAGARLGSTASAFAAIDHLANAIEHHNNAAASGQAHQAAALQRLIAIAEAQLAAAQTRTTPGGPAVVFSEGAIVTHDADAAAVSLTRKLQMLAAVGAFGGTDS